MRRRSEALGHIYNTHVQYNVATPTRRIRYAGNREALTDPFADESVKKMIAVDLSAAACYDRIIKDLELYLTRHAKVHDPQTYFLLQTVAGIGKVLALTLLYEIHDVHRFADVGEFISYSRLVNCPHTSAGKLCGSGGRKIGNAFIRWAFAEAVCLLIRESPKAKRWIDRKEKKYGKGEALSLLAAKLGRAVYWMLRRKEPFNIEKFFQS
jgi:transposase